MTAKRVVSVLAALLVCCAAPLPALEEEEAERRAERFFTVLESNPGQETALEQLWGLYAETGRTDALLATAARRAEEHPPFDVVWGRLLLRAGRHAEALQVMESAITARPDDIHAWRGLGDCLAATAADPEGHAESLERVLELTDPASPDFVASATRAADAWRRIGDDERAAEVLSAAAARVGADTDFRRALAESEEDAGRTAAALQHWREIAASEDVAVRMEALLAIMRLESEAGDPSGAIKAAEEAFGMLAPGHWRRKEIGRQLIQLHLAEESGKTLAARWEESARTEPEDPVLFLLLGRLHAMLGDFTAQRDWLRDGLEAHPSNRDLLAATARAESHTGSPDAAQKLYGRLHRVTSDPEAVFEMAALDVRQENIEAAPGRFDLLGDWRSDPALAGRVERFFEEHRLDSALRELLQARAQTRGDPGAVFALAELSLRSGDTAEATKALEQIPWQNIPEEDLANVRNEVVRILTASDSGETAIARARGFLDQDPADPLNLYRALDAMTAARQHQLALETIEEWMQTHGGSLPPEDAERRLFDLVTKAGDDEPDAETPRESIDLLPVVTTRRHGLHPGIVRRIAALHEKVREEGTEHNALRLARWQTWANDRPGAMATLRMALGEHPASIALREMLVTLSREQGDHATAIRLLHERMALEPEAASRLWREIGLLEMERGAHDNAIPIFARLARENPASADALLDLAAAKQRADQWYDALEIRLRAFDLADPAQQFEMRGIIASTFERLRMAERGLAFLESLAARQGSDERRLLVLREAAAFAATLQAATALEESWLARLRNQPDDPILRQALETLQSGTAADAPSMAETADGTARPGAVPATVNAAEAADRIRRELYAGEPMTADQWIEIARLEEAAGDTDQAAATWNEITRLYPRNTALLLAAAEFFESTAAQRRAAELIEAAALLEPADKPLRLRAAKQWFAVGERLRALSHLESIIEQSAGLAPEDSIFPMVEFGGEESRQLATRALLRIRGRDGYWPRSRSLIQGGSAADAPRPQRSPRLEAIELAAGLTADTPMEEDWLGRWEELEDPSERMTAFYHAGRVDAALDELLAAAMDGSDSRAATASYFSMAIAGGRFDRAFELLSVRDGEFPARMDVFLNMLSQWIAADGADWSGLAAELDTPDEIVAGAAWPSAQLFAAHDRHAAAAAIGMAALPQLPVDTRSKAALDVADWALAGLDLELAAEAARLATSEKGVSFAHPSLAALRLLWFLGDEAERTNLLADAREQAAASHPPPALLARHALLAGLAGAGAEARTSLKRLVLVEASGGGTELEVQYGFSNFIRESADQLARWGLVSMACEVIAAAVETDPALMSLRGKMDPHEREELRMQLVLTRLARAEPAEIDFLINELLDGSLSAQTCLRIAARLEQAGNHYAALQACLHVLETHGNLQPALAGAYRNAQLLKDAEAVRRVGAVILFGGHIGEGAPEPTAVALQLARIEIRNRNLEGAVAAIEQGLRYHPEDIGLLDMRAGILWWTGSYQEALELRSALFHRLGHDASGPQLVESALRLGREEEALRAFELLARRTPAQVTAILPVLVAQYQAADRLQLLADRIGSVIAANAPATARYLVAGLAAKGDASAAMEILDLAYPSISSPAEQFELLESLAANAPGTTEADHAERRLERLAMANLDLAAKHQTFRKDQATRKDRIDELREVLLEEWRDGTGDVFAGEILLQMALENGPSEAADGIVEALAASADGDKLVPLTAYLESQNHPASAAIRELLVRDNPARWQARIELATSLWNNGRRGDAVRVLRPLISARHVRTEFYLPLGEWFLAAERPARARDYFIEAVRYGPMETRAEGYLGLARAATAGSEWDLARFALHHLAHSHHESHAHQALAEYYIATGQAGTISPHTNEFGFPEAVMDEARALLAAHLMDTGQPERALDWFSQKPALVAAANGGRILNDLAAPTGAYARIADIWDQALAGLPSTALARQAAEFHLDRARAATGRDGAERIAALRRAHELTPGDYKTARLLETALAQAGDADPGGVYAALLQGDASLADRLAAKRRIDELADGPESIPSPSSPERGTGRW